MNKAFEKLAMKSSLALHLNKVVGCTVAQPKGMWRTAYRTTHI